MSDPNSESSPWRTVLRLDEMAEQTLTFGALSLRVKFEDQDVWIASSHQGEAATWEDPAWSRWPAGSFKSLAFELLFPDLPIVVKPQVDLLLYPRAEMGIYVACPLWVRVFLKGRENAVLADYPSQILSQTWFGTNTVEGDVCYWVPSDATRSVPWVPEMTSICPVDIRNTSSEELNIQRVCLRVAHLTLYWEKGKGRFWSDRTRIDFRGRHGKSEFSVTGQVPQEVEKGHKLASPREHSLSRLVAMTFATVRDFPSRTLFGN